MHKLLQSYEKEGETPNLFENFGLIKENHTPDIAYLAQWDSW